MSDLEKFYEDERVKWDKIAAQELKHENDHLMIKPGDDFFLRVRRDSVMQGVAEFLENVENKRVLEIGCGTGKKSSYLATSTSTVAPASPTQPRASAIVLFLRPLIVLLASLATTYSSGLR